MMDGYGNMNGMTPPNMITSFDSSVDASSVLDLVNGSSSLMMNGHGQNYDSGSSYFTSHNGKNKKRRKDSVLVRENALSVFVFLSL